MTSEKTSSTGGRQPPEPLIGTSEHLEYSSFSRRQKNFILGLAAFAGWFSSVSSFIYFPAIPALAESLGESIQKINLTVTSYLIVSGVIPSIVGSAADRFGRRPVVVFALTVYLGANVGLALQSSFTLLFLFRMLQSAGVSGTFCITYGVLSDLFTPAERGGYSGTVSFLYVQALIRQAPFCGLLVFSKRCRYADSTCDYSLNTPPSIGPLISGLLLLRWSWRSIFWFLSVATPCCLIPMVLVFPETARNIVGDGSRRAHSINKPVSSFLVSRAAADAVQPAGLRGSQVKKVTVNPIASLRLIRSPATALVLVTYGVGYATYSCLQASLSTLFLDIYKISGLASGLIYIPFGVACALSAFTTGKLLDRNYQKTAAEAGVSISRNKADDMAEFPIEKARLRVITWSVAMSACLIVSYGWQLQERVSMAGPLITQFFIGLTLQPMFTALNTLLVDLHQDCPSTAQAAGNLVRCEMAAGYLAALDVLLRALGPGWTFVLFAGVIFLSAVLLLILEHNGLKWRQGRLPDTANLNA